MKAKEMMKKAMVVAALAGAGVLPTFAETLCSGESAEVMLDLATGTVRTAADVETLTYSTEWDGGSTVALAANGTTLASGLTNSGTYDWTPSGSGLFTLTHTTATSSGDVVQTATFMIPPKYVAPVYVDGVASNGIAYWTTNAVPSGYTVVESSAERVTWGTAGSTSWYVVTNGIYQIDGGVECVGDVHLVLCDGAKLTVTNVANSCAGIATDANGSFTIYEAVPRDAVSSPRQIGILDVTGDSYAAGIGGDFDVDGLNITINGGIVTARAGEADESGAGIGGGSFCTGSNITINGGTVTTTSGDLGSGIGGGYDSDGSNITVNGGTVTATGGVYAAGIGGGGEGGRGEFITINGGTVKAMGGAGAAGIGGGSESGASDITIKGGVVTAIGGLTSPGIGGGGEGTSENIRIANAVVLLGTMDAIIDEGEGPCRYSADLIGSGGLAGDSSSDIVIDETAQVFFNLTGTWDYDNEVYIEETAPMPESFEGFVIMTPETQTADRVLLGGIANWTAATTFALTNAVTGATGEIEVNGEDVVFVNKLLSLSHEDSKLMLKSFDYSTINPPIEVDHTTAKVYTNAVEDATLINTPIVIRQGADAYVVYTADDGYIFMDGNTAVTNAVDTSVNPAAAEVPGALTKQFRYIAPVYVDNVASNGVAYWTANAVPSGFAVVESSAERVTWGTAGSTSWYVVTNGTYQIDGGVECVGDVHLVLCDGAKLTVTNVAENCAGIATDASGSFTIYGTPDGAGELSATAGEQGAGIGGGKNGAGSHITINGGVVKAAGGIFASSIGGGAKGTGSDITINGGSVTASGVVQSEETSAAAGIGGGNYGNGSDITINGGIVTAVGLNLSAGIGGGSNGNGSNITINDGVVKAPGGVGGAGIGGGSEGNGLDIAINGGIISAIGCMGGAAIGGGQMGTGSNIRIAKAVVSVQATATYFEGDYYLAEFIGNGMMSGAEATDIEIDASANVLFNLTGVMDGYGGYVEAPAPMPEKFEGFVIMTPETQTLDRVLVGGCGGLIESALPTFALTNATTGATGTIDIGGAPRRFASANLKLKHADSQLTLNVFDATQVGEDAWADIEDGDCTIFGTGATWAKSEWTDDNPLKAYDAAITNLVVEDGITGLGANSFENMWYVQNVTLAASVTNVGARAFKKCYGLTNVMSTATESATIGEYAFSGCHSLQSLSFAGAASFGTQSYTLQAAIYMKDGGIPVVYAMPTIIIAGKSEHIMGKKTLGDDKWTDVTNFTDEQKKEYHFFKIEMQEVK